MKKMVYDETPEVQLMVEQYPNINVTYCGFEGKSSFTDIDSLISIFEQPYKVYQNMTWYNSLLNLARSQNCKVILNGQVGNFTISYGDFRVHLLTLFREGKLISCWNEIHSLSRLLNQPLKRVVKFAGSVVIPYKIRVWRGRARLRNYDRFREVLIHPSLIQKWDVERRLDHIQMNTTLARYRDYNEERRFRANPSALSHIGAIETKLSLAHQITIRDPSRDRRVIEFCLAIPSSQYVRKGNERYLLRRAMKGILPEQIRKNMTTRGIQSADWIHRLQPHMDSIVQEVDQVLTEEEMTPYLDKEKIKNLRARWNEEGARKDERLIRGFLLTIIVARFVRDFNSSRSVIPDVVVR